ncbi:MAG: ATP-dependent metalloprotease FtsH, cell division protease FtsH [Parcubacteria group bacterium GW2011_GWC1_38_6]|nr:MAG: ATP-dependent metalloprotease FtsH, cell division protease FtsH [Parcubacteria group bacterium GW2011_GWC1_38_6]
MFLPSSSSEIRNYSEQIASKIDKEVSAIIKSCEEKTKELLKKNTKLLEKIALTLIQKEIIEKEEFEQIIGKKVKTNLLIKITGKAKR